MYGIYVGGSVIAQFVAPLTVRSNHPIFASDTLSLKRQVARRSAQRWEIETRLEPLSHTANELFVDLVTKGYSEAVSIITPQNYGVIHNRTATGTPAGSGAAGSGVVAVTGNTGLIPKGTFIKFASHSKVYMTTTDRNNNGNVSVYPTLVASISGDGFYYGDDVVMTCLYDMDTVSGMTFSDGILMDMGTVKLVEFL